MAQNSKNSPKVKTISAEDFEIPEDYLSMNKFEREAICLVLISHLLTLIDKEIHPMFNRMDIMNTLLTHTITLHEQKEMYEVCQVLNDVKKLVNEQTS